MRRRRKLPKTRKIKKKGRGIPYIYKNRIYFGKKPQTGTGTISKVIGLLLKKRWRRYWTLMVRNKSIFDALIWKIIKEKRIKNTVKDLLTDLNCCIL